MSSLTNRRVLLIVSGGIAAYKSLELIRLLRQEGCAVRPVLTRAGANFVTALSLQALAEDKVYTDLFSLTDDSEMGHIELSRSADLIVVVPATANMLAKMAAGIADDLATTLLLATDKPVLVAPAMNHRMWLHPATVKNVRTLMDRGVKIVGPNEGEMACHEFGPGRLAEPAEILAAITAVFENVPQLMISRRVVVTSGPTYEPIDPVRYLANRSSGRQGHAIAAALAALGANVTLISGPVALPDPPSVSVHHVETAEEMLAAVRAALPADCVVCAAAVADWRPAKAMTQKIKKQAGVSHDSLALTLNPDILAEVSRLGTRRPRLVIGFAAETENVIAQSIAKRESKGCDWIVANDVSPASHIMGGEENLVHVITAEGCEDWPRMPKAEVARRLAIRIGKALA